MIRSKITYSFLDKRIHNKKVVERVLNFNPEQLFNRIKYNKYSRRNDLSITTMFPSPNRKKCACGCGKSLTGRQRRWSSKECSDFAVYVYDVIANNTPTIKFLMQTYTYWKCCKCNCEDYYREFSNGLTVSSLEIDHIIPVWQGGGACWLGNYQVICHECHKIKSKQDKIDFNKQNKLPLSELF